MDSGNHIIDHDLLRAYPGAEVVFDDAFVALPGATGTPASLSGAIRSACESGRSWPVVLLATGSRSFESPPILARWLRHAGIEAALIAPATQRVPNRPRYVSPTDAEIYAEVHRLRRWELDYTLARLAGHRCFDCSRLVVMGLSEGGVAAATWRPTCNAPRLVMAWGIEDSYFARSFDLPQDKTTPILNLMGWQDAYFGPHESLSARDGVRGHGAERLATYPNARVVLYPSAGHKLLEHPQTAEDVVTFLRRHLTTTETPSFPTLEDDQ
ncbi:MAG: hypothetical protein R3D60_09330 [Paracoccaceae bacterium]